MEKILDFPSLIHDFSVVQPSQKEKGLKGDEPERVKTEMSIEAYSGEN